MAVLPTLNNLRGVLQKVIFVPIVYGFVSLLPMFLNGWENSDRLADRLFSTIRSKENQFDFIVVGGGTAGNLIANRLSEHYKVLLLEAGGTPSPFQTVPALALKFLNHPQTDWGYKTVPQRKACLNSVNQQSSWSSGRGLGGSSNINFMMTVRGHPMDYEQWADITGDPSWGYSSLVPYFKRFETFSGTSNDPESRGHNGEFRIRKPSYVGLSEDWVRAGQELGYPFVDLNGRHEEGFGILQYPIYKGLRQSTYSAFILPMHKSPRLIIRRYALVRKILFRDMNNMAYGVEYVRHGRVVQAIATKEVILSAGTLGSSKLLMLSGVGPAPHLEELGIPVRSNLPVGRNLQDHLAVPLGPFFIKEPKSFLFDRDVTPENIVRWLFLGTGPITTTGFQGAASIASSIAKSRGQGNWPDLHLILHGQAIHQGYVDAFSYAYSLQEDELIKYYSNAIGRDSFTIYVVNARPTSTGQVLLSGASINDPLVINPRYLEDQGDSDFKVLLEGVKAALTISNTSMFQRLGTEFTNAKLPGCDDFQGDSYFDCYIRRFSVSMQNPVGTVGLGHVVDPSLKVMGTRGLRVLDASIQPTLITTGTAASTLMIAEKGVDMILKDHGIPDRDTDLFDVIFGKNGFFKRNPILRILQREFDTINPLRAIFKPFTSFTSRDSDVDERERFTRNGRVDNPFLQVISSVFGNAARQTDASASGSAYVDHFERNGQNKDPNEELHLHKRSDDGTSKQDDDEKNNVISKNQWVLQKNSPKNKTSIFDTKTTFSSTTKASNAGPKLVVKTLNITELSTSAPRKTGKGKGGKRYALLLAILKEAELNATRTLPKSLKSAGSGSLQTVPSTPKTTQSPTVPQTQVFTATLTSTSKPVVEIVKFEKHVVDPVENEITPTQKTINATNNSIKLNTTNLGIEAKAVAVNPHSVVGIIPVRAVAINSNQNQAINRQPTQNFNPLSALVKSLQSLGDLVNTLTAKDRRPILTTPSSAERFTVSQTLNWFHNKDNNIFGNLFNTNKPNNNNKNVGNVDIGFGRPASNNNNNPFQFLFGNNNAPVATRPPAKAISVREPSFEIINSTSSSNDTASKALSIAELSIEKIDSSLKSNDTVSKALSIADPSIEKINSSLASNHTVSKVENNQNPRKNDIFSSWFKPLPTSQPSSSWFKPFDKPADKSSFSSSSWFKPLNAKQDSWIKPVEDKSREKLGNDKPTTTSWFQPFTFNNARITSTLPPEKLVKESKNPLQPFNDIFELFLGGLKKHERREVFKTINTMMEASKGLADLLDAGTGLNTPITTTNHNLNFFEQISRGKVSNEKSRDVKQTENLSDKKKDDKQYDNLLRDLISLNNLMNSHAATKNKPKSLEKPISEEIDEEFLLNSLSTTSKPKLLVKPISEEIDEEFLFNSLSTTNKPKPLPKPISEKNDEEFPLKSLSTTESPTTTEMAEDEVTTEVDTATEEAITEDPMQA